MKGRRAGEHPLADPRCAVTCLIVSGEQECHPPSLGQKTVRAGQRAGRIENGWDADTKEGMQCFHAL
jgi:hypothetical protein